MTDTTLILRGSATQVIWELRRKALARKTRGELIDLLVGAVAPDYRGLQNQKIEQDLKDLTGDDWVVAEWCPVDGLFCRYRDYATPGELDAAARAHGAAGFDRWIVEKIRAVADARRFFQDNPGVEKLLEPDPREPETIDWETGRAVGK